MQLVRIYVAAAHEARVKARVLRVGQIVIDTVHGVLKKDEAIPFTIQSALTIVALPKMQQFPSWTPADFIANTVPEICLSSAGDIVVKVT